jgi:hypothetical protein
MERSGQGEPGLFRSADLEVWVYPSCLDCFCTGSIETERGAAGLCDGAACAYVKESKVKRNKCYAWKLVEE